MSKGDSETGEYRTLCPDGRSRPFRAEIQRGGVLFQVGTKTRFLLTTEQLTLCLEHFRHTGWFPLGNNITAVTPGGLGAYFKENVLHNPKFASHVAAFLVAQGQLDHRWENNRLELKVV
jgi:hypothetical protein